MCSCRPLSTSDVAVAMTCEVIAGRTPSSHPGRRARFRPGVVEPTGRSSYGRSTDTSRPRREGTKSLARADAIRQRPQRRPPSPDVGLAGGRARASPYTPPVNLWRRWRADLARPEVPTSRDELGFLVVTAIVIVVAAQLTDPGTAVDVARARAGRRWPSRCRGPRPATPGRGLRGAGHRAGGARRRAGTATLEGAFFLSVMMVFVHVVRTSVADPGR